MAAAGSVRGADLVEERMPQHRHHGFRNGIDLFFNAFPRTKQDPALRCRDPADDGLVGVERNGGERRVDERAEARPERPAGHARDVDDVDADVGQVDQRQLALGGHLRDRARRDRRRSSLGDCRGPR